MGLDACVYCDCFEKGKLRQAPPSGLKLRVMPDGALAPVPDDLPLETLMAFDQWLAGREGCNHLGRTLVHHRLGNDSLVAFLKLELSREPALFPIMLQRVIYNGTHAGDFIQVELLQSLEEEVLRLRDFSCKGSVDTLSTEADCFMQRFREQMEELICVAKKVHKPISF